MDIPEHLFSQEPLSVHGSVSDMAIVINRQGICQEVLSLDEQIFGGRHLHPGESITKILPDNVSDFLAKIIDRVLVSGVPQRIEFPFMCDTCASEVWFVARCLRFPGSPEQDPLLLWYGRDITAGKIHETELEMYRDHLEEMVELRTAEQKKTNSKLREEIIRHEETTRELNQARERYDLAIRGANDGIWDWDLTDDSTYLSPQWKKMLGFEDYEIPNDIWEWSKRIHPEDFQNMLEAFGNILKQGKTSFANQYRMYHKNGSIRWIYIKGAVLRDTANKAIRMAGTCTDITERKHMENISSMLFQISNAVNTTHDLEELYAAIHAILLEYIEARNFYIALLDEQNDLVVFPYFRDEKELTYPEISHFSDPQTRSSTVQVIKTNKPLVLNTEQQIGVNCIGFPSKIWMGVPLRSKDKVIGAMAVQHYTWPSHDTSPDAQILKAVSAQVALAIERKTNENLLSYQALHDGLTKLPNRVLLRERIGQALLRAQRNKEYYFALAMIDLDRFKFVNDCHGHLVGDQLLQNIAQRIQKSLRSIDTLARLGGDEFAILFEELGTSQKIIHKIKKIQSIIRDVVNLSGYDIRIDSSVGVILKTSGYTTVDDVLRDADIAMYQAKSMGPGKLRVFSKSMHQQTMMTMSLEQDLRLALGNHEFYLEYQPVVNLKDRSIDGFEALIRWRHPRKGIIPPVQFIPIAEETGLIRDIGLWVFEQACTTLAFWNQNLHGAKHVTMAINLSAKQLSSSVLLSRIKNILAATGVNPEHIEIEITETGIMEAPLSAMVMLKKIKELGLELSLDDFGTGYSSLSYLHSFPTDILKIDRSFVSNIHVDEESLKIVKAIVVLAKSLNLSIIAEGIETPEQYEILRNMGCDKAQGFLFARPLSEAKCRTLMENSTSLPWNRAFEGLDEGA